MVFYYPDNDCESIYLSVGNTFWGILVCAYQSFLPAYQSFLPVLIHFYFLHIKQETINLILIMVPVLA
jgi:hypothetical protein